MNIYHSFDEVEYNPNTILTVGTFDGVHNGHKAVINTLLHRSRELGLRDIILTIHPHPQQVLLKPDRQPVFLLTTIEERAELLEELGVGNLLVIPFSYEFSQTSPKSFVKDYLYGKVGMKRILVGYDHMFGKNREGDKDLLTNLGTELGFDVERMNALEEKNLIISSTKIRHAIQNRDLQLAAELLGYTYFAKGRVVRGDMRGRKIGFPTANLQLLDESKLLPTNGVYFVRVKIDENYFYGMTNIGYRPTFGSTSVRTFETNIFDFDRDIYDKVIKIEFLNFIRAERKFSGVEELIITLKNDEITCRNLIKEI